MEPPEPQRCVAIIDAELPVGKAANAAAVLALSMGARHPQLVGDTLVDAGGNAHPGLTPMGIPVLGAPKDDLAVIRRKAIEAAIDVVGFPVQGQQTSDYAELQRMMSCALPENIAYLGIMLFGSRKKVSRIVGKYPLLRQP